MPLPNPPFPRRGILSRKVALPVRREPPEPFLRTSMGRRMILYAMLFVAALGMLVSTVNKAARPPQGPESRPESRTVVLTAPPKSFAPSDLIHQLVSVKDYSLHPNDGAVAACVQHLESLDVASTAWTAPPASATFPRRRVIPLNLTSIEPMTSNRRSFC